MKKTTNGGLFKWAIRKFCTSLVIDIRTNNIRRIINRLPGCELYYLLPTWPLIKQRLLYRVVLSSDLCHTWNPRPRKKLLTLDILVLGKTFYKSQKYVFSLFTNDSSTPSGFSDMKLA